MPGFNLTKTSEKLTNFKVEPNKTIGGTIGDIVTGDDGAKRFDVSGTYQIELTNQGITPVFFGSVSINSLKIEGKEVISGKSTGTSTIYGGGSSTITFEFNFTSDDSVFIDGVKNICSGEKAQYNLDGSLSGIVLGKNITNSGKLEVANTSCNIEGNTDNGNGENGENGENGNNRNGEEEPPDGGNGGPPTNNTPREIRVENSPQDDGTAAFTMTGEYNAALTSFSWNFGDGNTGNGRNVEHTYSVGGTYRVECEVTDSATGQTLATDQIQVTYQGQGWRLSGPESLTPNTEATWTIQGAPSDFEGIYNWDMKSRDNEGMNLNSTAENPSISYAYGQGGDYVAEVTARSNLGLIQEEFTKEINVTTGQDRGDARGENIEVIEEPDGSGTVELRMTGEYNALTKMFIWDMDDRLNTSDEFEQQAQGRRINYTYNTSGRKSVVCRATDTFTGEILAIGRITLDINRAGASSLPSMEQAAQNKDREF